MIFARYSLSSLSSAGHIHAGNVIIVDGVARLVDIENFVLGVPSFYRPFFVQHSKISTSELIDVYSFGHLLYELSCGYPLQESITRQPIECPSESLSNAIQCQLTLNNFRLTICFPIRRRFIGIDSFERCV